VDRSRLPLGRRRLRRRRASGQLRPHGHPGVHDRLWAGGKRHASGRHDRGRLHHLRCHRRPGPGRRRGGAGQRGPVPDHARDALARAGPGLRRRHRPNHRPARPERGGHLDGPQHRPGNRLRPMGRPRLHLPRRHASRRVLPGRVHPHGGARHRPGLQPHPDGHTAQLG